MSKPTTQQYVTAIYEQLLETTPKKQDQLISDFVKTINQHEQSTLSNEIITQLSELLEQKNNTTQITLVSSTKLNNLHLISRELSRKLKSDIEIKNLIKKNIIGGLILYYRDYKIDFSLSNTLKKQSVNQNQEFVCMDDKLKNIINTISEHQDQLFALEVSIKKSDKVEIINFTAHDQPNLSRLEKELSAKLHQKVIIYYHSDPNIIAGAIIEYDHKQIDGSIVNKLSK